MYISDSLFAKVNDPIAMGILVYLISVADADGNVHMSYSDIGNMLGYQKMKVMRCLRKLEDLNAVVTQPLRSRYTKTVIKVSNIELYKRGVTVRLRCGYGAVTVKDGTKSKLKAIGEREKAFVSKVNAHVGQYGEKEISDFCLYWTERNENGTKMRFEKEKVFEIPRRLARWHKIELEKKQDNSTKLPVGMNLQGSKEKDYTKGLERWSE